MDSVRVLWTDLAHNRAIEDVGKLLNLGTVHAARGFYFGFLLRVAKHHQDGVLARREGELRLEHLAALTDWHSDPLWLFRAMSQALILCATADGPEHVRCGLRHSPPYKGAGRQPHEEGLIVVHEWDRRMGRLLRRQEEDARRRRKHEASDRAQKRLPLGSSFRGRRRPPGDRCVGSRPPGDRPVVSRVFLGVAGLPIADRFGPAGSDRPGHDVAPPAIASSSEPDSPTDPGPSRGAAGDRHGGNGVADRRSVDLSPLESRGETGGDRRGVNRLPGMDPRNAGGGDTSPPTPSAPPPSRHNGGGRHNGHGRGSGPLEGEAGLPTAIGEVLAQGVALGPVSRKAWQDGLKAFLDQAPRRGQRQDEARREWERRHGPEPKE